MMTGVGAIALYRAKQLAETADYVCAMSLDALRGTRNAFLPKIHAARYVVSITSRQHLMADRIMDKVSLPPPSCPCFIQASTICGY